MSTKRFISENLKITMILSFGICFILLMFSRGIFVKENVAIKSLEKQGYSNVEVTKRGWFFVGFSGCDMNDASKITTNATNPAGKQIEIFVCTGWPFKGATIRTD